MAKRPTARKADKVELDVFVERYEMLSSVYGDPVETLFEIMTHQDCPMDLRARVAVDLMSFRYAKLKALETKNTGDNKPVVMTINLMAPTPQQALTESIDVTPGKALKLVPVK